MKVKFNYTEKSIKTSVICDTNVWYKIAAGNLTKENDFSLIPTSLTLNEMASSETMAHDVNVYIKVVMELHKNSGPIIPVNPFDFILMNHDSNYSGDETLTKKILIEFTEIVKRDIPNDLELDKVTYEKLIKESRNNRKPTHEIATFSTDELLKTRKNINVGVGQKEHKKVDTTEANKQMFMAVLNDYVKDKNYTIDWANFDWSAIELFLIVTEIFFKKLETTKGMKFKPNDFVDWLNMLYVTPNDKYLTFEKSWRKIIESDDRIKHYLYK